MFFLIFKRFVLGLITLFIVSLITFIGVEILPGDACTSYLEREAFGEALARELLGFSLNIFLEFSIFYFLVCNVFNLGFNINVNKSAIKFILT